jgi:cytidyltransferase-like protein
MTSLLIGRFQPLHEGHIELVDRLLREGRKVIIGLRAGPQSTANPYSVEERRAMFQRAFGDKVDVVVLPEDGGLEVVRGRDVGWELRTLSLESELEQISATALRAATRKSKGRTLWFLGLPASGKTTLANRVVRESAGFVLLDGDDVRKAVSNFDMGPDARLVHLAYMAFCCRQLNECGINVAAAFVTPLRQHRARIREILPEVKFIWLQCSAAVCAARDPKGLWKQAAQGALADLTGVGGAWEDPVDYALAIDTETMPVDEALRRVKECFGLVANGRGSTVRGGAHAPLELAGAKTPATIA